MNDRSTTASFFRQSQTFSQLVVNPGLELSHPAGRKAEAVEGKARVNSEPLAEANGRLWKAR